MSVTIAAVYQDGDWSILEQHGDKEELEFFLEDTSLISGWLGLEDQRTWFPSETSRLNSILSCNMVVEGTYILVEFQFRDLTTHGMDGTEYDYDWIPEKCLIMMPEEEVMATVEDACTQLIIRGICNSHNCGNLVGESLYARTRHLCEQCAKKVYKEEYETGKDPLYPVKQRVRSKAYRNANQWTVKARHKRVNKCITLEELEALEGEFGKAEKRWSIWYD
jgi:hypothetical protein